MAKNSTVKRIVNKLKSRLWFSIYYTIYQKSKLNKNMVFLESRNGSDMAGNILYIARELSTNQTINILNYMYLPSLIWLKM